MPIVGSVHALSGLGASRKAQKHGAHLLRRVRADTFPATKMLAIHFGAALLLIICRRSFFTTRCTFPTRGEGVARVPGPNPITEQHPEDERERYDTHSHNQD
jgi:hypothetical protein